MQPTERHAPTSPPGVQPPLPLWKVWLPSLLILCAAAWLALASLLAHERDQREHFLEETLKIERRILRRLQDYELILRGGLGLLRNTPQINRSQWREYVETLDYRHALPGAQGLGLKMLVPERLLAAHERERQADFPGYRVHPAGARPEYCPVVFLEPLDERNQRAIGFDLYSDPVRRAALDQARDTGQATLTAKIQLVQETGQDVQAGTLLQIPVFAKGAPTGTVAQRRAALRGFVYSPFRMGDFLHAVMDQESARLGIAVYDGQTVDPETLMFAQPPAGPGGSGGLERQSALGVFGRTWTLVFTQPLAAWLSAGRREPLAILFLGVLLAGAVLFIIRNIDATRERAEGLARRMTEDLRQSEAYNRAIFENSSIGIGAFQSGGGFVDANSALQKLLGYSLEELRGLRWSDVSHPDDIAVSANLLQEIRDGRRDGYLLEKRFLSKDGRTVWVSLNVGCLRGADGQLQVVFAVFKDISERMAAEATERQRQVRRSALLRLHGMHQAPRKELLDFALEQALALTESAVGYIYAYDDTSRQFILHSWSPGIMEQCSVQEPQTVYHLDQTGIWGDAVRLRQPILLNDFAAPHPGKKGYPEGHVHLARFLTLPVISAGRVVAVVGVGNKAAPYTEEDVAQLGLFTDGLWGILERQATQQELREVTERFQLAVRAGRIGLWDWDLKSGAVHCDAVMEGLFGITDKNRTGTPEDWLCRVHPEDREAVRQALATARDEGGRFEASFRALGSNGTTAHIEASAVVHLDPQGLPLRMVGVNIDVTRLRLAEKALRESETLFRTTFDQAPIGVATLSPDRRYTQVNQALCRITGYDAAELLTKTFMDITHPDDLPNELEQSRRLRQGEIDLHGVDKRYVRKDGSHVWVHLSVRSIRDASGAHLFSVALTEDITERRLAEEKLAQSHQFLQTVIDTLPNNFFFTDGAGRFIMANTTFASLLGLPMQDIRGRTLAEMGRTQGLAMHQEQDARLLAHPGASIQYEVNFQDRKGHRRQHLVSKTLVPIPGQDAPGIVGTSVDTTERLEAEEKLALVARFPLENPDPVLRVDSGGVILFANPAAKALLAAWGQEVGGALPEELRRVVTEILESVQTQTMEQTYAGEVYAITLSPFVEKGYVNIYARDITKRKRAEEALAQSEERFRTLAQVSPVGIFRTDPSGQGTYVNEQWSRITGHAPEAALGLGWMDTLHPDDRQRVVQAFQKATAAGRPFDAEYRYRSPRGADVWVLCRAEAERDTAGRITGFVGAVTDFTEQKRAQEALGLAKAQAEAATQAKALFLANMSHEIRTPLAGIIGTTRLLAQSRLDREQRHLADMAVESGRALLEVVNDILDFSKIEAGRLSLRPAPFALRHSLQAVAAPFAVLARERGLTLDIETAPATPDALVGDEVRLGQVLRNLLSNALKFTEKGGIRVTAAVEGSPKPDAREAMFRFSVSDTGIGIDPGFLPRIFDSFSQADSSYGKQHGGTGLGLAICKSLVEQMGGQIRVTSRTGAGSTFTFTARLGLDAEAPAQASLAAREDAQAYPAPAGPQSLRVLLAEDNPIGRVLMEHLLLAAGHHVASVGDGQAVLLALKEHDFDLVLMDVQMPKMDGLTATRLIRQGQAGEKNAKIAVVALTAYASKEDRERFLEAGLDDAVAKPVEEPVLLAAMERALTRAADRAKEFETPVTPTETARQAASAETTPKATAPAADPRFDPGYLKRSFSGHPDLLAALLHQFESASLPDLVHALRLSLDTEDLDLGGRTAHQARGTLGSIGAVRAMRLAAKLDNAARAGQGGTFKELTGVLLAELEGLGGHLRSGRPWGQDPDQEEGA